MGTKGRLKYNKAKEALYNPGMPVSQRAKQFMPFAALSGLEAALRKKELEHEIKYKGTGQGDFNADEI